MLVWPDSGQIQALRVFDTFCFSCSCRMLQCVCLLLLAASALGHLDETTLDHQWDEWKLTHRREYNGLVSVCRKRPLQYGVKSKMSWRVQGSVMKIRTGFAPRRWYSDSPHSCSWEEKNNLTTCLERVCFFLHFFFLTKQKSTSIHLLNSCFFLLPSKGELNIVHWEAAERLHLRGKCKSAIRPQAPQLTELLS